jgi:Glycosyl hydrolase family 79, N-terminal domain
MAGRLMITFAAALATFAGLAALATPSASAAQVSVSASRVLARTSPRYVSFAVDLDQVVGGSFWSQAPNAHGNAPVGVYDFNRPRLRPLARALGPAYLRISGTAANKTYYDLSPNPATTPPSGYEEVLTKAEWDAVNAFARGIGLQVVLGVNAGPGPRDANGAWLPDNARQLLQYTVNMRYPLAAVEFGNEPNLLSLVSGIPATYTAADYVRELTTFKALRDSVVPHALLMGPGSFYDNAGSETPYGGHAFGPLSTQVLPAVPSLYDLLAFHEYPATSSRCAGVGTPVPADPLAPAYLDGVLHSYVALRALGRADDPRAPIWYGEGASASCGGQQGYSDRFEASFWYLNALGLLAQNGLRVFVRQTLSGSDYGLINDTTLQPNPDYWAALLWRRLMGTAILRPQLRGAPARLRVYAACSRAGRGTTLLALNLDRSHTARLSLDGGTRPRQVYSVSAPALLGRQVELDGRALRTGRDGALPALRPRSTRAATIVVAPASYAFVVEPGFGPPACR